MITIYLTDLGLEMYKNGNLSTGQYSYTKTDRFHIELQLTQEQIQRLQTGKKLLYG